MNDFYVFLLKQSQRKLGMRYESSDDLGRGKRKLSDSCWWPWCDTWKGGVLESRHSAGAIAGDFVACRELADARTKRLCLGTEVDDFPAGASSEL